MARIRSVHPSFFTDEAVVSCSPLARLLYIGLWTDADDQGLFEWRPLQIKMRLLPGDGADAGDLLGELVAADLIAEFSTGGKRFGAIRDFRTYQRPKKPNAVHVLPPEWRTYVGLDEASSELGAASPLESSEPVPHQFPTSGEKPPQMEDGGEDVGEDKEDRFALVAAEPTTLAGKVPAEEVRIAFAEWNDLAKRAGLPTARDFTDDRRRKIGSRVKAVGLDGWRSVLATIEASDFCRGGGERGWKISLDDLFQTKTWNKLRDGGYGSVKGSISDLAPEVWTQLVAMWRGGEPWPETAGPAPDQPGTRVPKALLIRSVEIGAA